MWPLVKRILLLDLNLGFFIKIHVLAILMNRTDFILCRGYINQKLNSTVLHRFSNSAQYGLTKNIRGPFWPGPCWTMGKYGHDDNQKKRTDV